MPYSKNNRSEKSFYPCIYKIINLITHDFYIGSAWEEYPRFRRHWCEMKRGSHASPILQRAFKKYGVAAFQFETIISFRPEEVSREAMYRLEQQYINTLNPTYNIAKIVRMPPKMSEENKDKFRELYSKKWIVTNPTGQVFKITNLKKFCRDNNLSQGALWFVAQGRTKHHMGWKCEYNKE